MPPEGGGGVMIEAGAYVGFKAIGYADHVGPGGKVIAIEIDRDNFELMRLNVEQNGLQDVVDCVNCGVWSKRDRVVDRFRDRTAHTIARTEEHPYCTSADTIATDTLDNIIDASGVETVDFLNLQLNGAEIEALEGLQRRLESVKVLHIAACFSRGEVRNADVVTRMLERRGCVILGRSETGVINAVTRPFVGHFEHQRR
jgi:FkbM family methyltransferase